MRARIFGSGLFCVPCRWCPASGPLHAVLTPLHSVGTPEPGPFSVRPCGGGVWRQRSGTRRGLCFARTWRPRRRIGTSPGTVRSATVCCGWRWSRRRVPLRARLRPGSTRGRLAGDRRVAPTPAGAGVAGAGGFSTALAAGLTSRLVCDGCHRMSFGKCGIYLPPTKSQFYMCNCTLTGASRTGDPAPLPRLLQGRSQQRRRTDRGRTKKIALDPAESSAIDDAPLYAWKALTGVGGGPVGADPASCGAVVPDGAASWGNQPVCPVIQLFRPRCAAAGCPRAERGPRPRGSADARRACGST